MTMKGLYNVVGSKDRGSFLRTSLSLTHLKSLGVYALNSDGMSKTNSHTLFKPIQSNALQPQACWTFCQYVMTAGLG